MAQFKQPLRFFFSDLLKDVQIRIEPFPIYSLNIQILGFANFNKRRNL